MRCPDVASYFGCPRIASGITAASGQPFSDRCCSVKLLTEHFVCGIFYFCVEQSAEMCYNVLNDVTPSEFLEKTKREYNA